MRSVLLLSFLSLSASVAANDWLQWRGPTADNHAAAGEDAPLRWSETQNILWNTPVPGRGHSTPIIVGDRIFLATADANKGVQAIVAFDRATGKRIGVIVVHTNGLPPKIHAKNTHASPTIACDGNQLYVVFNNDTAVWATAYSMTGTKRWQTRVARFDPQKYQFGYGASPILHKDKLIVANEYDGPDSGIYALDTQTGKPAWKAARPPLISFSSPVISNNGGVEQLLISGCRQIAAYDPETGRERWKTPGTTQATCGTMVWAGDLVFASGGFPDAGTFAVRADGSQVVWQNGTKCYEQSMLVAGDYIYGLADSGVMYCWKASDGQEMWKQRLKGPVSASPLLVGDKIYASNELGTTWVIRANSQRYEELAVNQLGNSSFASPVVVDNRLYLRYASGEGTGQQEFLACIGE